MRLKYITKKAACIDRFYFFVHFFAILFLIIFNNRFFGRFFGKIKPFLAEILRFSSRKNAEKLHKNLILRPEVLSTFYKIFVFYGLAGIKRAL